MGDAGAIGATGATGPQGVPGAKGDTGATGPAGAPGVAGPKGDTGNTGPQGPAGAAAGFIQATSAADTLATPQPPQTFGLGTAVQVSATCKTFAGASFLQVKLVALLPPVEVFLPYSPRSTLTDGTPLGLIYGNSYSPHLVASGEFTVANGDKMWAVTLHAFTDSANQCVILHNIVTNTP